MDTKVYLTEKFLTEDECFDLIVKYKNKLEASEVRGGAVKKHIRNSKTFMFHDSVLCEKFQHEKMEFQLTEYVKDCFYDWHVDYYDTKKYVRKTSYSVLLNDDFDGGELEFELSGIVDMSIGDSVSFSPHLRHQVNPITSGIRYSLVAWELTI